MTSISVLAIAPVVAAYDFTRFGTIADVGGGPRPAAGRCTDRAPWPPVGCSTTCSRWSTGHRRCWASTGGRSGSRWFPGPSSTVFRRRRRRLPAEEHHSRLARRRGDGDPAQCAGGGRARCATLLLIEACDPRPRPGVPGQVDRYGDADRHRRPRTYRGRLPKRSTSRLGSS